MSADTQVEIKMEHVPSCQVVDDLSFLGPIPIEIDLPLLPPTLTPQHSPVFSKMTKLSNNNVNDNFNSELSFDLSFFNGLIDPLTNTCNADLLFNPSSTITTNPSQYLTLPSLNNIHINGIQSYSSTSINANISDTNIKNNPDNTYMNRNIPLPLTKASSAPNLSSNSINSQFSNHPLSSASYPVLTKTVSNPDVSCNQYSNYYSSPNSINSQSLPNLTNYMDLSSSLNCDLVQYNLMSNFSSLPILDPLASMSTSPSNNDSIIHSLSWNSPPSSPSNAMENICPTTATGSPTFKEAVKKKAKKVYKINKTKCCPAENCHKKFSTGSSLSNHIRSKHTNFDDDN
eukprot:Awhi_evm1s1578